MNILLSVERFLCILIGPLFLSAIGLLQLSLDSIKFFAVAIALRSGWVFVVRRLDPSGKQLIASSLQRVTTLVSALAVVFLFFYVTTGAEEILSAMLFVALALECFAIWYQTKNMPKRSVLYYLAANVLFCFFGFSLASGNFTLPAAALSVAYAALVSAVVPGNTTAQDLSFERSLHVLQLLGAALPPLLALGGVLPFPFVFMLMIALISLPPRADNIAQRRKIAVFIPLAFVVLLLALAYLQRGS